MSVVLFHIFPTIICLLILKCIKGGGNFGYALVLKTLTELKDYGRALSIALLTQGVGSLVGNPFAGISYNFSYFRYICKCLVGIRILIFLI